jgi:hypothetical protein
MESPVEATEFYTEEREANAALIAAAPEMLAALKAAWLAYEPQYISACAEDSERTDLDDAFDGVRAAIAKAEGRAP